jgi:hypothetical protein
MGMKLKKKTKYNGGMEKIGAIEKKKPLVKLHINSQLTVLVSVWDCSSGCGLKCFSFRNVSK